MPATCTAQKLKQAKIGATVIEFCCQWGGLYCSAGDLGDTLIGYLQEAITCTQGRNCWQTGLMKIIVVAVKQVVVLNHVIVLKCFFLGSMVQVVVFHTSLTVFGCVSPVTPGDSKSLLNWHGLSGKVLREKLDIGYSSSCHLGNMVHYWNQEQLSSFYSNVHIHLHTHIQCSVCQSVHVLLLIWFPFLCLLSFLFYLKRESERARGWGGGGGAREGGGGVFHTTSFTFCFKAVKINCSSILNIPLLLYKTDVIFPRNQELQLTSRSPPPPIPQPPPRQPCDTNTHSSNYRQCYTPSLSFITRLIFSSFERGLRASVFLEFDYSLFYILCAEIRKDRVIT